MEFQKLTQSEKEIMEKIWELNTPVSTAMLIKAFSPSKNRKPQTVSTFLTRLVNKNYLSVRKNGLCNLYTALISKDEFARFNAESLILKQYNGSVKNMISSLIEYGMIDKKEIEELKNWFNGM